MLSFPRKEMGEKQVGGSLGDAVYVERVTHHRKKVKYANRMLSSKLFRHVVSHHLQIGINLRSNSIVYRLCANRQTAGPVVNQRAELRPPSSQLHESRHAGTFARTLSTMGVKRRIVVNLGRGRLTVRVVRRGRLGLVAVRDATPLCLRPPSPEGFDIYFQ
mgnify:FL=1